MNDATAHIHETEMDVIATALFEHRDSGVTTVVDEQAEQITGASAWCYCGGTDGIDWIKEGPAWRGTFNAPGEQARRELREHVASAIASALRQQPTGGGA